MDITALRASVYEHLSQLFDGQLAPLPDAPPDMDGSSALSGALVLLRGAAAAAPVNALADHARLFVTAERGIAAPPYASWYLDGHLSGASTRWVERVYGEQGVVLADDAGEPADYLGTELEFMYFLCRHELAARQTANDAALQVVLDREAAFACEHLARWVPAFVDRVRTGSPGPLWHAAADLLSAIVDDDARRLAAYRSDAPVHSPHGDAVRAHHHLLAE